MNLKEEFLDICTKLKHLDENSDDHTEQEPLLVRMLELLKRESKENSLPLIYDLVWSRIDTSEEIIPFCMRELKWEEVRLEAQKRFEESGSHPRLMNWISDINHVYTDEVWEDADFYEYYRDNKV